MGEKKTNLSGIVFHSEGVDLGLLAFLGLLKVLVAAAITIDFSEEGHVCSFREDAFFIQQLEDTRALFDPKKKEISKWC